jgi:hypothetical protein
LFAQCDQGCVIEVQAFHQRDALAGAPLGLARHPHDAVACGAHRSRAATALRLRLPALRAHAAAVRAVDQAATEEFVFHANQSDLRIRIVPHERARSAKIVTHQVVSFLLSPIFTLDAAKRHPGAAHPDWHPGYKKNENNWPQSL